MEYSYLIGHRVKCIVYYDEYYDRESDEYIGYVSDVIIDYKNREKIFITEDKGNVEWFIPHHFRVKKYFIEILDEKYTKFTRFEIMEI